MAYSRRCYSGRLVLCCLLSIISLDKALAVGTHSANTSPLPPAVTDHIGNTPFPKDGNSQSSTGPAKENTSKYVKPTPPTEALPTGYVTDTANSTSSTKPGQTTSLLDKNITSTSLPNTTIVPSIPPNSSKVPEPPVIISKNGSVVANSTEGISSTTAANPAYDIEDNAYKNLTKQNDTHKYYNSSIIGDTAQSMRHWVDFSTTPKGQVHPMLSNSHRRAAMVNLTFDFPFYGHLLNNVTIATGGFIYTGGYIHPWLAATQYIAPLMANFDTNYSSESRVHYADNGTAFTVFWENVTLQDHPEAGNFSFQATLHKSGDVVFVYKSLPLDVSHISDNVHPVKVGLSDAYIIDRTIFFVRRKTIYEYHRIDLKDGNIQSGTAIYFTALPTCVSFTNCTACLENKIHFKCSWCPETNQCSDGMDRHRQQWLLSGCDKPNSVLLNTCHALPTTPKIPSSTTPTEERHELINKPVDSLVAAKDDDTVQVSVAGVIGILFVVVIVVGLVGWLFYAYFYPHTPSGQFLIRYRPSTWGWRRNGPHYTAAAIHM